jgi:hypothetical protein
MANTDLNPQKGLQGTSPVYDMGTTPNTRTAVSQKVRILTPAYGTSSALFQMGVLYNFAPSQNRNIEEVRSIGFGDMVAELVPGNTDHPTANVERALLYLSNIWQATGYAAGVDGPVRSLRHHRWPFDVEEQLVFSTLADNDVNPGAPPSGFNGGSGNFNGGVKAIEFPTVTEVSGVTDGSHTALITMYEACWWGTWGRTYNRDTAIISETGDINITDTHDFSSIYGEFLATGNDPTIGQLGSIRFGSQIGSGSGLT